MNEGCNPGDMVYYDYQRPVNTRRNSYVYGCSSDQSRVDLFKKGELGDYPDVLKPQYRGKITINDPTTTGPGGDFMIHLAVTIYDLERAKDYLRQLVKQQEAVIERDNRIHLESVARGKYPIGIAPNPDPLATFLKLGSPLWCWPWPEKL